MGVNDHSAASKLSLETFQDIFGKVEPGVLIDSYEEAQGSGRGDNYTATLYRIQLTGHRICSADEDKKQIWEKSVICKRLPENIARREAYKSDKLFRNEVEFYTNIIPELIKFQRTRIADTFQAIPKCYLARQDLLIMEDLRTRGFKMPDRKNGLSIDEVKCVLKEVATLHSLSLAYKFQNPNQFENLKNRIKEGIFCSSNELWYKNYYEQLTNNAINMVSDILPSDSKYIHAMKDFIASPSFFSKMIEIVHTESPLSAICHGDCWANNFLFKYNSDGDLQEVCLVDFQLIRYSSVALDIANLLYCCTSKSMRDEHLCSFIKHYTTELYNSLKVLCKLPEFLDTEEKLETQFASELKSYGKFAFGLALDIIPISTCASEDAPDLYLVSRTDSTSGAPELNFPPNDLCRQKMSDVLIDMVDGGML
ncbi:uncharacterized protein LOC129914738 [Episyrphus balteatus]|uniref:uncharacterized protein LOC129914738 n=1 Tax=Episyrphus balteatus TaxID=286459 RepID=UPI002485597F|nr:uncharacterized protein LOC129914738 [Episyrphus balteatus]